MTSMKLSLSIEPNSLERIPKDFTIYVNNSKHYKFHSFLLFSFSPRIRRMFLCDPTLRSIHLPIPDTDNSFQEIKKIIYERTDKPITIDNIKNLNKASFYLKVANFLENAEFASLASKNYIKIVPYTKFDYSQNIISLVAPISYIAENFREIILSSKSSSMHKLPLLVLDCVLSSNDLDIEESQLFRWMLRFLSEKKQSNPKDFEMYYGLYAHLRFESLKPSEIEDFLKICPDSAISGALWMAVCSRLKKPLTQPVQNVPYQTQQEYYQCPEQNFPYKNDPFKGVLNYWRTNNYEIVCDCGGNKQWAVYYLMDYADDTKYWENADKNQSEYSEENQWLMIGFENATLLLTHYTLGHSLKAANSGQPKHWKVFGSNDTKSWIQIDEVDCATDLNKHKAHKTYAIPNPNRYFQYFKFQQISNWSKKSAMRYRFVLSAIEFFGDLKLLQKDNNY